MQKLSYRDQIIISVVLAIMIGVIGYMFLIKPTNEKIETTKTSLEAANAEWNDLESKIRQINSIKERIQKKYDECVEYGNFFVNAKDIKRSEDLENFIKPYIDKNGIYIKSNASFTDPAITTLVPYTLGKKQLNYNIGQYADLEMPAESDEETEDSGEIQSQSLPYGSVNIDYNATRASLMQFMKDIKASGKTIEIKSVSFNSADSFSMDPAAVMSGNLSIDVYYADMISDLDIAAEIAESEKG